MTKTTENKSLRALTGDERSRVSVSFYPKGNAKSQVAVVHEKLAGPDEVVSAKANWNEALDRLKAFLEA